MRMYDCDACGKATLFERTDHRNGSWSVPEGRFCRPCQGQPEEVDHYDVTVYAAEGGLRMATVRVIAQNILEAQRLAVEEVWDERLTAADCKAEFTVELVDG